MYCYCDATKRKLRDWLRARYKTPQRVGQVLESLQLRIVGRCGASAKLRRLPREPRLAAILGNRPPTPSTCSTGGWGLFRKLDPKHLIAAHGVAGTLESLPSQRARRVALLRRSGHLGIHIRGFAKGRRALEAVPGRGPGSRRVPRQALLARGSRGGAALDAASGGQPSRARTGVLPTRTMCGGGIWSPARAEPPASCIRAGGRLLDGPLFGARPFGMDGSVTPRAEMAGKFARWANAHADIWKSRPVQGDIALVFAPESELFNYVQQGRQITTRVDPRRIPGVLRFEHPGRISSQSTISQSTRWPICPYPVMLKQRHGEEAPANSGTGR